MNTSKAEMHNVSSYMIEKIYMIIPESQEYCQSTVTLRPLTSLLFVAYKVGRPDVMQNAI